jgi:anti-anti-sigma factor
MKITTQDYNEVPIIELQGEFVGEFVKPFQDSVSSLIATGASGLVLDMSKIVFLDSKALESMLWLKDYCTENNCQLKLAGLDDNCKKILEVTRLAPNLDTYDELAQAVKSFV